MFPLLMIILDFMGLLSKVVFVLFSLYLYNLQLFLRNKQIVVVNFILESLMTIINMQELLGKKQLHYPTAKYSGRGWVRL